MTELRKAVVELLTYYPAEEVLAEIALMLDKTSIPLAQTDTRYRELLATALDKMLRDL